MAFPQRNLLNKWWQSTIIFNRSCARLSTSSSVFIGMDFSAKELFSYIFVFTFILCLSLLMFQTNLLISIEPAMLLMHNSIKTHPNITYGLLEFICKVSCPLNLLLFPCSVLSYILLQPWENLALKYDQAKYLGKMRSDNCSGGFWQISLSS